MKNHTEWQERLKRLHKDGVRLKKRMETFEEEYRKQYLFCARLCIGGLVVLSIVAIICLCYMHSIGVI